MRLFLYNLLLPIGFVFFLPGLWWKLRHRPGWKATFAERFGRFTPERRRELANFHNSLWIHAVSVGETVVALSLIKAWQQKYPAGKIVLSTTTTTGQELARKSAPENCAVIFCPLDFRSYVRATLDVIRPRALIILETELWPNMINECVQHRIPVALVNARMSDHSARGYRRFRCFFAPLLRQISLISAQSEADAQRYLSVAPEANVRISGNMKFDQHVPENLSGIDFKEIFGDANDVCLLAASTHPNEEEYIVTAWSKLRNDFPGLRLILVPRHAERGGEISAMLKARGVSFLRRSDSSRSGDAIDVLLADTTGEMLKLMAGADIVIMGKSLAGHTDGHNLIEPALLGKPIVTGSVLKNFRFLLNILREEDALLTVAPTDDLAAVLKPLLASPEERRKLGERGKKAVLRHAGAIGRTLDILAELDGGKC